MEKSIEKLMIYQQRTVNWNLYNERQHVENLFYSRFNFFIVFYGMFIAAITEIPKEMVKGPLPCTLLSFCVIISCIMQYVLAKNYQTLNCLLKLINHLPDYHTSPMLVKCTNRTTRGYTGICIAYIIPIVCVILLYILTYYVYDVKFTKIDGLLMGISSLTIFISIWVQSIQYCKAKKSNMKKMVQEIFKICPKIY